MCVCVHNANMFFQQTSTAWMIDYIITPLIVPTEWIMGAVRRSSRHPEYHYLCKNCNLKNAISQLFVRSIVVGKIYPFHAHWTEFDRFSRQTVPFGGSLHGSRNLNGTLYSWNASRSSWLTFRTGYFSGNNRTASPSVKGNGETEWSIDGAVRIIVVGYWRNIVRRYVVSCARKCGLRFLNALQIDI